jgi:hypothetical protein
MSQNSIDQTGWINTIFQKIVQYVQDLYAPLLNPTFKGTVTFVDTSTTPNTSTLFKDYALKTDGTIDNLNLTGDVSFPDESLLTTDTETTTFWKERTLYNTTFVDTSTETWTTRSILDFLTTSTAASTYAPKASPTFTGTVTFSDASTITNYLKSTTAASTYLKIFTAASTYAPKSSPTFTGTIS